MSKVNLELPMAEANQHSCCSEESSNLCESPENACWTAGELQTVSGPLYRVKTELSASDRFNSFKARWGVGRMDYTIPPGLYAVGDPNSEAPVLVTANYKLSFDHLRSELKGLNLWVLVLDTKGINVWCAAGKGTFSTEELLKMVRQVNLDNLVSHRKLILPQLAAPGVAAHRVNKLSGFSVSYGPVRASDLPAYLAAGNKATREMRHPRFNVVDRLILTPVELTALLKPLAILFVILLLLNFGASLYKSLGYGLFALLKISGADFIPFLVAGLIGVIMAPALLPLVPGRSLAWKGWLLGLVWTIIYIYTVVPAAGWLHHLALLLILPAVSAFLSMNFTGSTTYTSLSGVIREMTYAVPLIGISTAAGIITLVISYFSI